MSSPGRGKMRVARGLSLAAVCWVMSIAAHVAAGGAVHMSTASVVGGAALSVMCVAAADGRRSFGGILAVVLLSQVGLHLFAGAGGHREGAVTWTLEMAAHHAVAAVVVSGVLAYGERLIWVLWRLLALLPPVPVLSAPEPVWAAAGVAWTFQRTTPALRDLCLGGPGTRAPPMG